MAYVQLELAKKQCNIDEYITDDDEYIQHLIDASENIVQDLLKENGYSDVMLDGEDMPSNIKHAILCCVSYLYERRSDIAKEKLRSTIESVVWSQINYFKL